MSQPPPGSLGPPFIGEALQLKLDPFRFTLSRTKRHGPVWKTRILGDTVVYFAGPKAFSFFMNPENFARKGGSPKFIEELLHPEAVPFLDGEEHRATKTLLLAAFTDAALAGYLPRIFAIIERFVDRWVAAGESRIAPDLEQLGFDIADVLFAASDPMHSNVQGAIDFARLIDGTYTFPLNLPFTPFGKAIKARDRLRAYIHAQVAAKDGEGTALGELKRARGPNGERLSTEQLEIELLHFLYAAPVGLTAAIAWMLVALGRHPGLAERLRVEADATLGQDTPSLAQARSLVLARTVAREVLRAYPIAPGTFWGVAKKDLEIDGYRIRAGWKGVGAIWATLQDGAIYPEPAAFKPERLPDRVFDQLPKDAYVPQGGGGHEGHWCPAGTLVALLMPAFLAWFTQRYDLVFPTQDTTPGGRGIGPLPRSGLRVKISPRPR